MKPDIENEIKNSTLEQADSLPSKQNVNLDLKNKRVIVVLVLTFLLVLTATFVVLEMLARSRSVDTNNTNTDNRNGNSIVYTRPVVSTQSNDSGNEEGSQTTNQSNSAVSTTSLAANSQVATTTSENSSTQIPGYQAVNLKVQNESGSQEWITNIPNNLGWNISQSQQAPATVSLSKNNVNISISLYNGNIYQESKQEAPAITFFNNGAGDLSAYRSFVDDNGSIYQIGTASGIVQNNGQREFTPFVSVDYGAAGAVFNVQCFVKNSSDLPLCEELLSKVRF